MLNMDLKKSLKHLYGPSAKAVEVVDVPPLNYLMLDGSGNPNTAQRYADALPALYGLAYAIRAISKDAGTVFTVMPLEGLWSYDGQEESNFILTEGDKDRFEWTLMILQPDHVTAAMVEEARAVTARKKPSPLLDEVRFERYEEGEAVQILHMGSYDDEGPTIKRLHDHIIANGWDFGQRHHEIYLNDPRKVAPEKIKTIIRQPFVRG